MNSKKPSSKSSTTHKKPLSSSTSSVSTTNPLPPSAPTSSSTTTNPKKRSSHTTTTEDTSSNSGKRAKRSVATTTGKKSLREEELGVGAEIGGTEEDDEDQLTDEDEGEVNKKKKKQSKVVVEKQEEDEEDEDEDDEGGDGGVTRCVCGDDNEEMSSGLMIQCDTCKCWQHGPCVGLWEEKECPNRYFCELCKPHLHGPGGLLRKTSRSKSTPGTSSSAAAQAAAAARRQTRSPSLSSKPLHSHSHATSHSPPTNSSTIALPTTTTTTTTTTNPSGPTPGGLTTTGAGVVAAASGSTKPHSTGTLGVGGKKRSTMNSRDAAYDDAIALSILEAGGAARRDKLEGRERDSDDSEDENEHENGEERGEKSGDEKEGPGGGGEEGEVVMGKKGKEKEKEKKGKGRAGSSGATSGTGNGTKGKRAGSASAAGKGKNSAANGKSTKSKSSETGGDAASTSNLVVPKIETLTESQVEDGEEGEVVERKKPRNISPELGEEVDKASSKKREEGTVRGGEKETDEVDEDAVMKDVEEEGSRDLAVDEPAVEVSPSRAAQALPTAPAASSTTHRAKHPNQYTYRPKNGPTASASASTTAAKRASPTKPSTSSALAGAGSTKTSKTKEKTSTSSTTAHNAIASSTAPSAPIPTVVVIGEKERAQMQWASELGIHLSWSIPEHLKHLTHLLPGKYPEPINVPTSLASLSGTTAGGGGGSGANSLYQEYQDQFIDASHTSTNDPTSTEGGGGASFLQTHYEPPTKVRFPGKRVTMPEMKKRVKNLVEYLDRVRQEVSDREKKDEVLRRAIEANQERTGRSHGSKNTSPPPRPLPAFAVNGMGTSGISENTLSFMEGLSRDLVMFRERFES